MRKNLQHQKKAMITKKEWKVIVSEVTTMSRYVCEVMYVICIARLRIDCAIKMS